MNDLELKLSVAKRCENILGDELVRACVLCKRDHHDLYIDCHQYRYEPVLYTEDIL